MGNPDAPPLDTERLIQTLAEHGVAYVIVGGIAAIIHGATNATFDFDVAPHATGANLDALAAALGSLNAKLRLEDGSTLSVPLDRHTLAGYELSTWRTDAGDIDVIRGIPTAEGMTQLAMHEQLAHTGTRLTFFETEVIIAGLDESVSSWIASRGWRHRRCRRCVDHRRGFRRRRSIDKRPRRPCGPRERGEPSTEHHRHLTRAGLGRR